MATSPARSCVTKPPGRQPIVTRAVPNERIDEVLEATARALDRGERIYWICPVIEGSEADTAMAAVERHRQLAERFGPQVGLVHGRLPGPAKAAALDAFAAGETRLLVATTVVEVGVDVPEASIMVIEHAERFGLAQLHQLRGRVGRGHAAVVLPAAVRAAAGPGGARPARASCARPRTAFAIAEEDLRLRGPGRGAGHAAERRCRPSASPTSPTMPTCCRSPATWPSGRWPATPACAARASEPLRVLLHLFERHDAVRLLAAG